MCQQPWITHARTTNFSSISNPFISFLLYKVQRVAGSNCFTTIYLAENPMAT